MITICFRYLLSDFVCDVKLEAADSGGLLRAIDQNFEAMGRASADLEHDRFKWAQARCRFFEKKRRKKFLFAWDRGSETSMAQVKKVFLLLL